MLKWSTSVTYLFTREGTLPCIAIANPKSSLRTELDIFLCVVVLAYWEIFFTLAESALTMVRLSFSGLSIYWHFPNATVAPDAVSMLLS